MVNHCGTSFLALALIDLVFCGRMESSEGSSEGSTPGEGKGMRNKGLLVVGCGLLLLTVMAPVQIHRVQDCLAEQNAVLEDCEWAAQLGERNLFEVIYDGGIPYMMEDAEEAEKRQAAMPAPDCELPAGERILRYEGGYWIMEWEMPWGEEQTLTMNYFRDENFEVALDGKLFDGLGIYDGVIVGTLVVNGTYDAPPEEVIMTENQVIAEDGTVLYPSPHIHGGVSDTATIYGADEGYFCTADYGVYDDNDGLILHWFEEVKAARKEGREERGWIGFEGRTRPVGPCRDGLLCYRVSTKRSIFEILFGVGGVTTFGYMNKEGKTVIPAIFEMATPPYEGCAMVVYHGEAGVIDLKATEERGRV